MKRTWVDDGQPRDWLDAASGEGREFLREATQVKNIWIALRRVAARQRRASAAAACATRASAAGTSIVRPPRNDKRDGSPTGDAPESPP